MSRSLLAVLIIRYFIPLSQSLLQCSNSVLTIQALFYGHHKHSLSQSLLQCSNSVLNIQVLFHGHHELSLSQSLLQCSSSVLTMQALFYIHHWLILWPDCFLLCSKPFIPARHITWSLGMGFARLTFQIKHGYRILGDPPMMFLDAHAPDGLLAPVGLLGTSHRFLFKIDRQNTTILISYHFSPAHDPYLWIAVVY